jgi:hypothetical protein
MRSKLLLPFARASLWIVAAIAGFASRANAYICYDSNSCLCQSPTITWTVYGTHCCTYGGQVGCQDASHPQCGTPWVWQSQLATCGFGSSCIIKLYANGNQGGIGTPCSCGTCS